MCTFLRLSNMSVITIYLSPLSIQILILVLLTVNFVIYNPIIIFYSFQFWKLRNESYFKKRHPYFVLAKVIAIQVYISVSRSINWIGKLSSNEYPKIMQESSNFFVILGVCAIPMIIVRFWWLYFDYTHALQLRAMKWQKNIVQDIELPWTLKYRYLGNRKYLATIIIIADIIALVSIQFLYTFILCVSCICTYIVIFIDSAFYPAKHYTI